VLSVDESAEGGGTEWCSDLFMARRSCGDGDGEMGGGEGHHVAA
jgi:hypothetical protein